MNTCSEKYLNSTSESPDMKNMVQGLARLYDDIGQDSAYVFPLLLLMDKLSLTPSLSTFSAISELEKNGFLKKIIRIESPALGGIEDYSSLSDIPEVIDDFRTGNSLVVTSEHIKVLYSIDSKINQY